jgi:CheY-like chemotaxis protein
VTAQRILVVDDNVDHALLTLDALETCGFGVLETRVAHDGAEALRVVRDEQWAPHLCLVDIQMPVVDGFELLQELQSDPSSREIPVVMLTSSSDDRDVLRSYGLGTTKYLTKPVSAHALRELVSRIPSYWAGAGASPVTEVPS